jgi:hypothetical protein
VRNPHEGITSRNFKEIANKKDNKNGTRLEQTEFIRGAIRRGSRRGGPLWMVVIGEKLGLYKALAEGPLNSAELAAKTRTDERYVREWLASQAAGGYITYNEQTRKFSLGKEQAFTLANEHSPAYLRGAFQLALGSLAAVPRITESFRCGAGMAWHERDEDVFHGCEKFFRPSYAVNLLTSWIPSL